MQTLISQIGFTFVEDATALAEGFANLVRTLAVETFNAMRARLCGPVDRLARACDVGNVIAARQDVMERRRISQMNQKMPTRRRPLDRLNPFRGLHHLT
jgi:hypothetical protein